MPPYNQEGARVALEDPHSKTWVRKMTQTFQHRSDLMVQKLNHIEGIRCKNRASGALRTPPADPGSSRRPGPARTNVSVK